MGNFKANLLAHSVNPVDDEAITFELCYERFIHAEFMTHRAFSRNASSSRAIPYKRMLEWTQEDPALPLHLGRNQKGMQSGGEVDEPQKAVEYLLGMLDQVAANCTVLVNGYDLHKEIVNRYLEPWGWINVVATMSRPGFMNFLKLRMDPHAHPNIQRLAVRMAREYRASTARRLEEGDWHLPYVTDRERDRYEEKIGQAIKWFGEDYPEQPEELLVWSVARCAWVSYKTVDGKVATWENAKRRHDDCVALKHCTPLEHQLRARADHLTNGGNMRGYDQYRHMVADESCSDFDYKHLLDTVYADRDFVTV